MSAAEVLLMVEALQGSPANDSEWELAGEIARVVEPAEPAFGSRAIDEAVLAEMAWRESRFVKQAVGDGGRSLGFFQLQRVPLSILQSTRAQTEEAYARLRASAQRCGPSAPLAAYASGSCGRGRRLSAVRMAEARKLLELVEANRQYQELASAFTRAAW